MKSKPQLNEIANALTLSTGKKMYDTYHNYDAWKIKTDSGMRSLESRVCGMRVDLAEAVLRGEIGITTAIKITKECYDAGFDYYEYHIAQVNQRTCSTTKPWQKDCTDGRSWSNPSEKNMTRRNHQG